MSEPRVAVILAAGLGTRMKSSLPKVMHEVLGKPMIGHVVQTAIDVDCANIAVVVGHGRELVESYLRTHFPNAPLSFHVQHQMLGTGDAVRSALAAYESGDPQVAVLCGDVPNLPTDLLLRAFQRQESSGTPAVVITAIAPAGTSYGRIVRDADDHVEKIVEFRDADEATRAIREINSGSYVFSGKFLRDQIHNLNTDNAQGEFYLTDLVEIASKGGNPAHPLLGEDIRPLDGVNTRLDLAAANAVAREAHNRSLMLAGVTMLDPATTWIDASCTVEADVTLEPNVVLRGRCHIASGAHIESGVRLEDRRVSVGERVLAIVQ